MLKNHLKKSFLTAVNNVLMLVLYPVELIDGLTFTVFDVLLYFKYIWLNFLYLWFECLIILTYGSNWLYNPSQFLILHILAQSSCYQSARVYLSTEKLKMIKWLVLLGFGIYLNKSKCDGVNYSHRNT